MDGSANQNQHPPPALADGQPDYPPIPQQGVVGEDPFHHHHHHHHHGAPPPPPGGPGGTIPQAPPLPPPHHHHPHHQQVQHHNAPPPLPATGYHGGGSTMHHQHAGPGPPGGGGGGGVSNSGGGGGSAMSALTAAAVAAKPATPTSQTTSITNFDHMTHPSQTANMLLPTTNPPHPQQRHPTSSSSQQQQQPPPPGPSPSTGQSPLGKVVESGHEHTGRWTKEEHEAFLAALQLYGKEWKKVAARVKTRTVVQTRTHAQKYFQKLQKVLEAGGDKEANTVLGMVGGSGISLGGSPTSSLTHSNLAAMMDLGIPNSTEKKAAKKQRRSSASISSSAQKQKQHQNLQYQPVPQPAMSSTGPSAAISRSNSATAAALLNMSNDRRLSASSIGPPSATTAGAYSHSGVPNLSPQQQQQQHGFTTTTSANTNSIADASPSSHGFGFPVPTTTGATGAANNPNSTNPNTSSNPGDVAPKRLSIMAPTHDDMITAGNPFPEPSPAACGKRKMAEIAAAQMLAGVASVGVATMAANQQQQQQMRNSSPNSAGGGVGQPVMKKRASVSGTAAIAAAAASLAGSSQVGEGVAAAAIVDMPVATSFPDPAAVGEDGRATPPPPLPSDGSSAQAPSASGVVNNVPPGSMIGRGGLSLQIVNPDTLAAQQDNGSSKRRLIMNGQASPSTPWDGQLEALVSQVKSQEPPPPPQDPSAATNAAATDEDAMHNQAEAMTDVAPQQPIILPPLPLRSPRTALQLAVCNGSVNEVSQICSTLVSSNNSSAIMERDDAGFHPLHSAAALGLLEHFGPNSSGGEAAVEICRLLIDCGADVTCRDAHGNTPVHWAARAGHDQVFALLLLKSCPLDVQNDAGETALHWAMRAGDGGAGAVKVLVENGARVNVFNRNFRRPLDVAAEGFAGLEEGTEGDGSAKDNQNSVAGAKVDQQVRRSTRWNLMRCSSQCRTLVLHHQECLDHLAKSDHDWEVPDRIDNIMSTLTRRTTESCIPGDEQNFKPYEVTISNEFERATLELLSRIHSAEYLAFVNDLSKDLERKRKQQLIEDTQLNSPHDGQERPRAVVPFTPMVQRKIMKEAKTKEDGHSDTAFSAGSLKAARRAAGAVQHAVDCVLVGRNRNAFCIVRPPGHHAGINGLLSDAESCGFCLFNNVAAGAMHALSDEKHRPRCERCAIVDIDAHHGNGTEEIVRKCHDSGRLLFFSVHLYDHDKPKKGQSFQYKFYPGTGAEDDVAHNVINVPIAPLWREKEVVKSISLASNGGTTVTEPRQTRQRSREEATRRVPSLPDLTKYNVDESIQFASLKPNSGASVESASVASSDTSQSSKPRPPLLSASPHYPPHYLMGTGRLAYRRAIQHRLLPALRAFNPDLIILSTGFDAARGDVGNARHYANGTEAMGFDLEPEDYAWTARKVCEVADICCDGRVVSVLEGGYGRTPPPIPPPPVFGDEPAVASEPVKQKLDKSFFSDCAVQHLKGLVDPYYAEDEQQNDSSNRKRP